jgi:hypothetical protein
VTDTDTWCYRLFTGHVDLPMETEMESDVLSLVVPRNMRRANDIVKKLLYYYPQAGRAGCRDTCARLFGHENWQALEVSCKQQRLGAPFDEACSDLARRRRAQARLLCSELGRVDPVGLHDKPMRASDAALGPIPSSFRSELRLAQAWKRYQQLLAQILVSEIEPTAGEPEKHSARELLASASRGTVAALPLYLARWWNLNIPHQHEVGQALCNVALDANCRADLLRFGQHWGTLCMYHADSIDWSMVMGTACLLAERYADLSLPYQDEVRELVARRPIGAQAQADFERLCESQWMRVIEYLNVYPRDDLEEVVRAQPKAFLDDGDQVEKILSDPRSRRGTWRTRRAGSA